jgi:hypothetical protein
MANRNGEEYWLVGYQFEEILEVPRQDGIIGEPQRYMQLKEGNEVIPVHPLDHIINCLKSGRRNYKIDMAIPISREQYFSAVGPAVEAQKKVDEIADKIQDESIQEM